MIMTTCVRRAPCRPRIEQAIAAFGPNVWKTTAARLRQLAVVYAASLFSNLIRSKRQIMFSPKPPDPTGPSPKAPLQSHFPLPPRLPTMCASNLFNIGLCSGNNMSKTFDQMALLLTPQRECRSRTGVLDARSWRWPGGRINMLSVQKDSKGVGFRENIFFSGRDRNRTERQSRGLVAPQYARGGLVLKHFDAKQMWFDGPSDTGTGSKQRPTTAPRE